jgi:ATP:cob(I)alamin adenosyltransferase
MNPSLRTFFSITEEEVHWLNERLEELLKENTGRCNRFVLPAGTQRACFAHVLRTDGKKLVRMLYRHAQSGGKVEDKLFDFANLISGYFFQLALWLNAQDGFEEIPFVSRNYK